MRILMVNDLPWVRELGGARVQLELAEELHELGHRVDHFDRVSAFGDSPPESRVRRLSTPRRFAQAARTFIRANAGDYDVIDATEGWLPLSKRELRFDGLLVTRSVGLSPIYRGYVQFEHRTWPELVQGTMAGRSMARYAIRRAASAGRRQLFAADLINLHNHDELAALRKLGVETRAIVLPGGISTALLRELDRVETSTEDRLRAREVAFIGSWSLRKGKADWPHIVRRVRELAPGARFSFLGTAASRETVVGELHLGDECDFVSVVPSYESSQLAPLLARATVGAFPSYAEAFGFGVVELLAAGLPTVAYAASGPGETLAPLSYPALVPVGDAEALANRVADLLTLNPADYSEQSAESAERAKRFCWRDIAKSTENEYEQALLTLPVVG